MTQTTNKKAADATNVNGLHITNNSVDFPTADANFSQRVKAVSTQVARLALAGHVVHQGQHGDFTVCKYGMTRYCKDFTELQAFARQLGVTS